MPDTIYPDPGSAFESFAAATADGNAEVAQAASALGCWRRHGESALKVFAQGSSEGFAFTRLGDPIVRGRRALIPASAQRPGRPKQGLWFLAVESQGSWGIAGAVRSEAHAARFLDGMLPGVFEVTDLAPGPRLETWARQLVANLEGTALLTAGEMAETTGVDVVGLLPIWPEVGVTAFAGLPDEHPVVLAYGDLAQRLIGKGVGSGIAVASATPREGVPDVAANLAATLAALGQTVLVIDMDVMAAGLHLVVGSLVAEPGLTEVLADGLPWDDAIFATRHGFDILAAGRREQPSVESFTRFADKLTELRQTYDRVIVITPPTGLPTLCSRLDLDGLLVVHAGSSPAPIVRAIAQRVGAAGKPLVGLVANRLMTESIPDPDDVDGEPLRLFAEGVATRLELVGTHALPSANRAMAGIASFVPGSEFPETTWTVFDTSGQRLTAVAHGTTPTVDLLLTGIEGELPELETPMPDNKRDLDPEAISAVVQAVLAGFTQAGEGAPKAGDTDLSNLPEQLTEAIAAALDQAGKGEDASKLREEATRGLASAREAARKDAAEVKAIPEPKEGDGEPDPISQGMRQAFGDFIKDKGDGRAPDELIVDQDFLANNGSELAGLMLGAFAKALIPDEPMEMDVDVKDDDEPDKKVKVKLDLGKLIQGFVKPIADGAKAQGEQKADDEAE